MAAADKVNEVSAQLKQRAQIVADGIKAINKALPNIPQPQRERLKNLVAQMQTALREENEAALDGIIKKLEKLR